MVSAIIALVVMPAVASLTYAIYWLFRFSQSRRGVSKKNELLVGVLGAFSIFIPNLVSEESRRYLIRFLLSSSFFVAYCIALFLVK